MIPEISIKLDAEKLRATLRRVPVYMREHLADAFDHLSRSYYKRFISAYLSGPPGIKAKRTGMLTHFFRRPFGGETLGLRSSGRFVQGAQVGGGGGTVGAFMRANVETASMGVEIFSDSPVMKDFEFGAVRRAAGGKKIAIPFSARYSPFMYSGRGQLRPRFKRASGIKGMFKIRSRQGGEYLVRRIKKAQRGKDFQFLFYLVDRQIIKKKIRFYESWRENLPRAYEILNAAVDKAARRA